MLYRVKVFLCATIILISFAARLFYIIKYPIPVRDSKHYELLISKKTTTPIHLQTGNNPDTIPLLPLIIYSAFNDLLDIGIVKSGIVLEMIIGNLFVLTIWNAFYVFSKNLKITFLLSLLAATQPRTFEYFTQMTRDGLYLFFSALYMYYIILYLKRPHVGNILLLSVSSFLSSSTRYEGIEFIFISNIFLISIWIYKKQIKRLAISLLSYNFFYLLLLSILLFSEWQKSIGSLSFRINQYLLRL